MHRPTYIVALLAALALCHSATAGVLEFRTYSTATQKLASPLFGAASPVTIAANGTQDFTFDTGTGIAGVTSDLSGADFPNPLSPGSFWSYHLVNTTTVGSFTPSGPGTYTATFPVQFALTLTSGPLAGVTFETNSMLPPPVFTADTALPFPPGTTFASPDPVGIYAAVTVPGFFNAGDLIADSFDRTVVIDTVIPEPASLVVACIGVAGMAGFTWRRRKHAA